MLCWDDISKPSLRSLSVIDVAAVQKGLKAKIFGKKIYAFESIDSTNNCARTLAGNLTPEGTVIVAEYQTAGRGRLGRLWTANPGENLTFSVVLRPSVTAAGLNLLPLLTAVAVTRAVDEFSKLKPECKWPNDLLLGGKKVCGILLESTQQENTLDFVIAGIGINVNQISFPPDIADRATSLRCAAGKTIEREALLRSILEHFEQLYLAERGDGLRSIPQIWLSHAPMIGKIVDVTSEGSVLTGKALGIAPDGGLILATDGGDRTVYAGDVTVHSKRQLDHTHAPRN